MKMKYTYFLPFVNCLVNQSVGTIFDCIIVEFPPEMPSNQHKSRRYLSFTCNVYDL